MKAMIFTEYGSPELLHLEEIKKPVPAADQVLVRVHAASVNYGDVHFVRGDPFPLRFSAGFPKPKIRILGWDVAGQVEAVGANVRQFRPGNEVFGDTSLHGCGAFAEYKCVPEAALVLKPAGVSFEQAAAVPMAALTALQGLRDNGRIQPGQRVLIYGASGGVGTFAIQIAKAFGAEVTAVCSTRNINMVRSIGADSVIDYTRQDFSRSGQRYDLILAVNGYRSILDYRRALALDGTYVMAGGNMTQVANTLLLGPVISRFGKQQFRTFVTRPNQKDLTFVKSLMVAGKLTSVIDACYPLSQLPQALLYMEKQHTRGKVIITMQGAA